MFFVPCIVTLIRCQYNEYFRQNLYVKELAAPKKYMSTVINKQKTDVKSYRNPHQIYPYKINKAFLHVFSKKCAVIGRTGWKFSAGMSSPEKGAREASPDLVPLYYFVARSPLF